MKTTYCVKCKKETDNIDPKVLKYSEQKIMDYLCNQNLVFVKIEIHDL